MVRKWVYGSSFEDSLVEGYLSGVKLIKSVQWTKFSKLWKDENGALEWKDLNDLLAQSEIVYSYSNEIAARELFITDSAILSKIPEDQDIIKKGVVQVALEKGL